MQQDAPVKDSTGKASRNANNLQSSTDSHKLKSLRLKPIKVKEIPLYIPEKSLNGKTATGNTTIASFTTEPSIFTGHSLHLNNLEPVKKPVYHYDWMLGVFLMVLIFFAYIKVTYNKRLREIINAALKPNPGPIVRDDNVLSQRVSIFLSIVFLLNLSLFIFQAVTYYGFHLFNGEGFVLFIKILTAVFLLNLAKTIVIGLLGFILKLKDEISEYILNMFLFNKTSGLFVAPLLVFIAYFHGFNANYFIFAAAGIFSISFIKRLIRTVFVGINKIHLSKIYLLLYICTLEIIPLLILVKVIIGKM